MGDKPMPDFAMSDVRAELQGMKQKLQEEEIRRLIQEVKAQNVERVVPTGGERGSDGNEGIEVQDYRRYTPTYAQYSPG